MTEAVDALIADGLADSETTWSLGGFGALAEFVRTADEPVTWLAQGRAGLVTGRGGIALDGGAAIPVAYETAFAGGWSHAITLCVTVDASRAEGGRLTDTGVDTGALRPENAGDNLFDLGLSLPGTRFGLRTGDPRCMAVLEATRGRDAFHPDSPVLDLVATSAVDLVVATPIGRVEVFAAAATGEIGPRGFLVPRLLALRRTHAATAPIPPGLVPVASLHPPHPCRNALGRPRAFDGHVHAAFQALHRRWGPPDLVALKARLVAGTAGAEDLTTRRARNVARVVRIQGEAMSADPNHDAGKS